MLRREPTIKDLVVDPDLRKVLILFSFLEILVGIIYFGAHIAVSELVGNVYLNLIFIGGMEAFANITSAFFNRNFRRKPTLYVLFFLSFVIYGSFIFIGPKKEVDMLENAVVLSIISTVLVVVGKWLNTTAYVCFHAYMAELVDPNYMAALYGSVSFIGSISLVFVP